jgi:hypothetical protein
MYFLWHRPCYVFALVKKSLCHCLIVILISTQIVLPVKAAEYGMDPRDPMMRYQAGSENMQQGAMMGAALYLVSKLLGETIGDMAFSKYLRDHLPFMHYIVPPSGWLGWKEEILNLAGYTTLGAAVGSVGSGGLVAQQFQMGLSDAMSHWFLSNVAEMLGNEDFADETPFIDLVMVKTASQIIRDELIPAGAPPLRGRSTGVLVINGAIEITANALIGAVEGATMATLYTQVRGNKVELREFFRRQMKNHAWVRGIEALNTVVMMGPRVHVSKSEKAKIQAYAEARGVDIRWALDHAQFRNGNYLFAANDPTVSDDTAAYQSGRNIVFREEPDIANTTRGKQLAAHEAYHMNQDVSTPNWLYLRMRHPDFRKQSDLADHDSRIFERFAETYLDPEFSE